MTPEPATNGVEYRRGHVWVTWTDEYGRGQETAFRPADEQYADRIRGEIPDGPAPVVYVATTGKHYYESKPHDELPDAVLEALTDAGHTLVGPVSAGWDSWGGRPEFADSLTYADFSTATVIAHPDRTGGQTNEVEQ
jgi:hypothetical protein